MYKQQQTVLFMAGKVRDAAGCGEADEFTYIHGIET